MPELPEVETVTQDNRHLQERYHGFCEKGLNLNLTRGNPSRAQLDCSSQRLWSSRYFNCIKVLAPSNSLFSPIAVPKNTLRTNE
jgi:hypothetical protein